MINSITINNDSSLLLLGTNIGFRLINLSNLKSIFDFTFTSRKITKASLYKKSNIIFFTESSKPNKITIFDVEKETKVEQLKYNTEVLNFKLLEKYIYVHTSDGLLIIHDLQTFSRIHIEKKIYDFKNFKFDIPLQNESYFGYNTQNSGDLKIIYFEKQESKALTLHKDKITLFSFNKNGEYVASLAKGTLLKLICVETGLKREFWLNYSDIPISCISFDYTSQFISVNEKDGDVILINLLDGGGQKDRWSRGKTFLSKLIKEKPFFEVSSELKDSFSVFDREGFLYVFNKEGSVVKYACGEDKNKIQVVKEGKLLLGFD